MSFFQKQKNKKMHDHLHNMAIVNTVLAVAALLAVAILTLWVFLARPDSAEVAQETAQENEATITPAPVPQQAGVDLPTEAEIAQQYRNDINALLSGYDFSDSARAEDLSYGALDLLAPRELRSMHLQVVVALQDAQQGKTASAQDRIEQLKSQYDWFLAE